MKQLQLSLRLLNSTNKPPQVTFETLQATFYTIYFSYTVNLQDNDSMFRDTLNAWSALHFCWFDGTTLQLIHF